MVVWIYDSRSHVRSLIFKKANQVKEKKNYEGDKIQVRQNQKNPAELIALLILHIAGYQKQD